MPEVDPESNMQSFTDFALNVLGNLIASGIEKVAHRPGPQTEATQAAASPKETENLPPAEPQGVSWKAIQGWPGYDSQVLTRLLSSVDKPVVYFLIEDKPSTYYNVLTIVAEDVTTGDWYPFKVECALQGTGGGWGNTRKYLYEIAEARKQGAKVCLSLRVARQEHLASLRAGEMLWSEVKAKTIPALLVQEGVFKDLLARFEHDVRP